MPAKGHRGDPDSETTQLAKPTGTGRRLEVTEVREEEWKTVPGKALLGTAK